jgi:hypothetical protein
MKAPRLSTVALSLALGIGASSANAVLERVGPNNLASGVGGYPAWYQDTTGLALEFCDPKNQAEVDGGWCLLLPGDVTVPEVFPTNFFDEHFYFAAGASLSPANGARTSLTLAVEAAFANGAAAPGDQVTFSRIRVVMSQVPVSGTYRIIHPYGEQVITVAAGDRIFITDDVGINCPPGGPFDCALQSRLGPFLLPSATPGGAEMAALTAANPTPDIDPAHFGGVFAPTAYPGTGLSYIADPARIGPVTGSTAKDVPTDLPGTFREGGTGTLRSRNIFRIEGPPGSGLGGPGIDAIETTGFSLMGRVFADTIPGRVDVNRASYARSATGQKLDVFATGFETTQGRLPAQPRPAPVQPQLSFFDAPCTGTVDPNTGALLPPFGQPTSANETQMLSSASNFWGQARPAVIPTAVCVKDGAARDINGNVVPAFFMQPVADEVTITQALYDPSARTLTVSAASSDATVAPTLTLGGFGPLAAGQIVMSNLSAPPAKVRVLSSAGGSSEYQVATGFSAGPPPTVPAAANDSFSFPEDSGPQLLNVLGNDSNVTGGTVTITAAPRLGTATVATDGTVTYTPNLNANGTDGFAYTVTVGTTVSNTGNVTLNINSVNDPPVAVNDTANAVANTTATLTVLANDTDPDGAADLRNAVLVAPPAAGATVTGGTGGAFSFTATTAGNYTFTYRAQDAAGALSANAATVTVQVAAAETINIALAEFRTGGSRWRVNGTDSVAAGQTLNIAVIQPTGTLVPLGSAVVDGAGAWAFDQVVANVVPLAGARVQVTSQQTGAAQTRLVTIRR